MAAGLQHRFGPDEGLRTDQRAGGFRLTGGILSQAKLAAKAMEIAEKQGGFTIFALVDALTRLAGEAENAGDRLETDQKAASLLALAV